MRLIPGIDLIPRDIPLRRTHRQIKECPPRMFLHFNDFKIFTQYWWNSQRSKSRSTVTSTIVGSPSRARSTISRSMWGFILEGAGWYLTMLGGMALRHIWSRCIVRWLIAFSVSMWSDRSRRKKMREMRSPRNERAVISVLSWVQFVVFRGLR